jgi:acetyl-CoA carboxylase, biotin carboxylase subunit
MFHKILIANRGEIAVRVIRTCREMGIKTVAVYSEADRNALHVQMADEAYCIGPAASNLSYLVIDNIIKACKDSGAEAVHPGYGFLSERSSFARKLKENKIVLIGPSPESMDLMGSKIESKQAVSKFNVPLVPGIDHAIRDIAQAKEIADKIGYPVLIKASAGGGGKGMRIVNNPNDFEEGIRGAQSEALGAFGDDSVFIEKYIAAPRHIEIQVLADNFGNTVYLFERECSIQRRHQKLVEEAPCCVMTPELRKEMGEAAVKVAKACNYSGAGTVEFLVDEKLNFYFLEMNTRLQVEHPITELITGTDLVKEQILVAAGHKLTFNQEDLKINGHAIELRLCAEDPYNNFLPEVGKLSIYRPAKGPGIRVDDCVEEDMEIPIYYDNMFAKLIVWAPDRIQAIARMKRAISEFKINGIANTLSFGHFVMEHTAFTSGDFNTGFIDKHFNPENKDTNESSAEEQVAVLIAAASADDDSFETMQRVSPEKNKAKSGGNQWYSRRKI